ncbi:MAG: VCBS repeat-containing protein, partial [Acidobacteriota bacterium]
MIRGRSSFGRWVAGDRSARFAAGGLLVALVALGPSAQAGEEPAWTFIDVTAGSGIAHAYRYDPDLKPIEPRWICGGAAVADVEGDGDLDLYFVGGELGVDRFFLNAGDGTFTEASARAGLAASGILSCGPVFVDLDGDGADDLVVPSIHGAPQQVGQPAVERPEALPRVYRNQGDGTFVDVSATC